MPLHHRSIPGPRRRRRGFSLLELVVVMTVAATIAAIAAPRYANALSGYRTDLAVKRILADLEYAATLAQVSSVEVNVKFKAGDKDDESYYFFENIDDPERPGTEYRVVLREEPYRVVLDHAPAEIAFDIFGAPKNSGTLVVTAGPSERTISVDKTTGEITVP